MESATDGILTYDAQGNPATTGFTLDFSSQATTDASVPWLDIYGFEVADLCVDQLGLAQDETTENGFTVQRIWSIANAAAGMDPCVPVPSGEVYFNAFPTVSVVVLDVGKSATIEVDALATGETGAWTVTPLDGTDSSGDPSPPPGMAPYITFSIPGATTTPLSNGVTKQTVPTVQMKSGEKVELTVTMNYDPGKSATGEADAMLFSTNGALTSPTAGHVWPFVVLTTAEATSYGLTMALKHDAARRRTRSHARSPILGRWH
jgi:hypothetical protein